MTNKTSAKRSPAPKAKAKASPAAKVKATSEADTKAKHTATLRSLAPKAREINARLERADAAEGKADDLRLSASVMLAEAKAECEAASLPFKAWCEDNVKQAYETCRKLVVVGQSPEPALALADLRAKAAKRMAKSRDKAAKNNSAGRVSAKGRASEAQAPSSYVALLDAVAADKDAVKIATEVARQNGLAVVSQEQSKAIKDASGNATIAGIKSAINKLTAADRRGILRWLTERVEEEASAAIMADASPSSLDIPASLDRRAKPAKGGKVKRGAVA